MPTSRKKSASKDTPLPPTPAECDFLIELVAGKEEANLSRPFLPDENEIEVLLARNGQKTTYPLFEVCCILQKEDPNHLSTLQNAHDLMEIETIAGSQHLVRVAKNQQFQTGFYGKSFSDQFLFHPGYPIRTMRRQNHIGFRRPPRRNRTRG